MQMEFNTDRQRRDLIYDCVGLLAKAKKLPIYMTASGKGVGDDAYHITISDSDVWAYVFEHGLSATTFSNQCVVPVPYDVFDPSSTKYKANDSKFNENETVSMIYGRIGQLIYKRWREWRHDNWPEVK